MKQPGQSCVQSKKMFYELIVLMVSTEMKAKAMITFNLYFIFSRHIVSAIRISNIVKVSTIDKNFDKKIRRNLYLFVVFFKGMNDYASIIFYVMRDESLAYICFCSIMKRIRANFATDGVAIATKFHHLKVTLQAIDPVYWNYLESCDAGKTYRFDFHFSKIFLFRFFKKLIFILPIDGCYSNVNVNFHLMMLYVFSKSCGQHYPLIVNRLNSVK